MLNVEQETHGDVVVLKIEGQLDALSAPQIKPTIDTLFDTKVSLFIFDMTTLELIDSSGIGLVVSVFKRARAMKGDLCLVGLKGQPMEVYKLLELKRAIKNEESVTAALQYLKSQ